MWRGSLTAAAAALLSGCACGEDPQPLKVSAIVPESSGVFELQETQDLTVVYSRPVIALGSDFDNATNVAQPFVLSCSNMEGSKCNLNGTMRWVTTSIGRFTPTGSWPTDLDILLSVDPTLTAYDGTKITPGNDKKQNYATQRLTMSVGQVESKKASDATGGSWRSNLPYGMFEADTHEVPEDGVISLWFNSPVDPVTVGPSLKFVPKDGGEPITVSAQKCNTTGGPYDPAGCLVITPSKPLSENKEYGLVLPKGSRYSASSGPTKQDTVARFIGLIPFKLYFTTIYNYQYMRYRVSFRHGLASSVTADDIKAAMKWEPNPEGDVNVTKLTKTSAILEGRFLPQTKYALSFSDSSKIIDGFGRTFLSSSTTVSPGAITGRVIVLDGSLAYFEGGVADGVGTMGEWGAVTIDPKPARCNQKDYAVKMTGQVVTEANLEAILREWVNDRYQGYPDANALKNKPDQEVTIVDPASNKKITVGSVSFAPLDTAKLLASSGLALVRYFTSVYENYQPDVASTCHYRPESQWVSSSDVNPVVMMAQGKVTVWVTSLSGKGPVANATVHVYKMNSNDYVDPNKNTVTKVGQLTTDKDGIASVDLKHSESDPEKELGIFVAANGQLVKAVGESRIPTVTNEDTLHGSLVTDRRLYRLGETVNVKGYVQRHSKTNVSVPSNNTFRLGIRWNVEDSETRFSDVTLDPKLGTFNLTLVVPANATLNEKHFQLQCTNCAGQAPTTSPDMPIIMGGGGEIPMMAPAMEESTSVAGSVAGGVEGGARKSRRDELPPSIAIGSPGSSGMAGMPSMGHMAVSLGGISTILIADPREPTAVLTMTPKQRYLAPGSPFNVDVTTATYTGSPVVGAKVKVRWNLISDVPVSVVVGVEGRQGGQGDATNGEVEVVTDSTGKATATLNPTSPNVTVGGSFEVTADWMGPTGEVLTQSGIYPIAYTTLRVQALPTSSNPLPGTRVGFFITVTDDLGTPQPNTPVTLSLYAYNSSTPLRPSPPNGDVTAPTPKVLGADCTAQGSSVAACMVTLPSQAGSYSVVLSVADSNGKKASAIVNVGKTAEEWKSKPLASFDTLAIVPDRDNYTVGETAKFNWYNPYPAASALVLWGNMKTQKHKVVAVAQGNQTIEVPLSAEECTGGCSGTIAIAVPRRSDPGVVLPADVAVSPLFDLSAPRTIIKDFSLAIVDKASQLNVAVALANATVAPGSETSFEVEVKGQDGSAIAGASVCVVVVNKAFLDLAPYPLRQPAADLALDSRISITSYTPTVATYKAYASGRDTITRRLKADPYVSMQWHLTSQSSTWYTDLLDVSDDTFYGRFVTDLTGDPYAIMPVMADAPAPMMEAAVSPTNGAMSTPASGSNSLQTATMGGADAAADKSPLASRPDAGKTSVTLTPQTIVRSQFVVTPLFSADVTAGADGKAKVTFKLPDNVGTFIVRAYATKDLKYGAAETPLTVRQPQVSLSAKLPRIARLGDVFNGGVTVTMTDTEFRGKVKVTAKVVSSLIAATSPIALCEGVSSEVEVSIDKAGPAPAVFKLCADAQGPVTLQFSVFAGTDQSTPSDSVEANITIYGWQDPVSVATSMAIDAKNANPWAEGVQMPDSVPNSGTMGIVAGVGHMPAVQVMVDHLANLGLSPSGADLVSLLAGPSSLSKYLPGGEEDSNQVLVYAQRQQAEALKLLQKYTVPELGLLWSPPRPGGSIDNAVYADPWLNAFGLHMVDRAEEDVSLTKTWEAALRQQLMIRVEDYKRMGLEFADWNLLAWSYLGLGLEADLKASELSLDRLTKNIANTSYETQSALGLAYVLNGKPSDPVANEIAKRLTNSVRVLGRTAYIGESGGAWPSFTANSLALSFLSKRAATTSPPDTPLLSKIAEYVAQQGKVDDPANPVPYYAIPYMAQSQRALAAFGMSDYDQSVNSTNPDLSLRCVGNDTELLAASFNASTNDRSPVEKRFTFGGAPPAEIKFYAQGTGEASVVVSLDFIPAKLPPTPVMRGFGISKILQILDPVTNKVKPGAINSSQALEAGTYIQITLQITSPDMVDSVIVMDGVPGGLEPMDTAIYQNVPRDNSNDLDGQPFPFWWFTPFQDKQVTPERVTFFARRLWPGVHTVTYTAIVNTAGAFTLPPAKVHSASAPEILGLSTGGWVVTDSAFLSVNPTNRQQVTVSQPITPIQGSERGKLVRGRPMTQGVSFMSNNVMSSFGADDEGLSNDDSQPLYWAVVGVSATVACAAIGGFLLCHRKRLAAMRQGGRYRQVGNETAEEVGMSTFEMEEGTGRPLSLSASRSESY